MYTLCMDIDLDLHRHEVRVSTNPLVYGTASLLRLSAIDILPEHRQTPLAGPAPTTTWAGSSFAEWTVQVMIAVGIQFVLRYRSKNSMVRCMARLKLWEIL